MALDKEKYLTITYKRDNKKKKSLSISLKTLEEFMDFLSKYGVTHVNTMDGKLYVMKKHRS